MKRFQSILALILCLILLLSLGSCSQKAETNAYDGNAPAEHMTMSNAMPEAIGEITTDKQTGENPFVNVATSPVSTFSADVDTASYALFRKLVNSDYSLTELKKHAQTDILRTEEMVNYFDYNYTLPADGEVFGTTASIAQSPWNDSTYLLMLGLATEAPSDKGSNNLVFLIDVSGSMASADKLPLLKNAFSYLVSALDENDTVSIVTYSGKEEVVIQGCAGNKDEEIMNAIHSLKANGSTNGESGLKKAYEIAAERFIKGGNNRIIMASDGDLNVGISSPEELKRYISQKKDEGIFLSVLGFGTGNYRDDTMSALAQNGNGVYYYIDSDREAEKVLGTDLLSTLHTVAKDVKFQLTFDPNYVSEYRLIGYENRLLNTEDFNDDTKDAGEVGAGHTLTVCYELKLAENALTDAGKTADWMKLAMRYKLPEGTDSILKESWLGGALLTDAPSKDFQFVASVIQTAMIVNGSAYNQKQISLAAVLDTLTTLDLTDDQDKSEFKALIEKLA